jgi:hypothetical protein
VRSRSLARLTLNSRYVRLNSYACGTPSRCTGTTRCGDTRCPVRAYGNESRTRPTRVAHLCFVPLLSEHQRYEKRKAPRDDRPAEFQYCLQAWLSREPRRMGAPHGSSCEAVKRRSGARFAASLIRPLGAARLSNKANRRNARARLTIDFKIARRLNKR